MIFPSCVFFGPSGTSLFTQAKSKAPYDVIIVPGIPFDSVGGWANTMQGRVYWSKYLFDKGITKNIIYSGSAVYTPFIESEVMALYAKELGIPAENIFAEKKAEHSTENLYYSYYLAKSLGFEKIALATDPFQSKMLSSYPKKLKVSVDLIPFVKDSLRAMPKQANVKIDTTGLKVLCFESITERENRYKRFWGTMGKNIERVPEDVRTKK